MVEEDAARDGLLRGGGQDLHLEAPLGMNGGQGGKQSRNVLVVLGAVEGAQALAQGRGVAEGWVRRPEAQPQHHAVETVQHGGPLQADVDVTGGAGGGGGNGVRISG